MCSQTQTSFHCLQPSRSTVCNAPRRDALLLVGRTGWCHSEGYGPTVGPKAAKEKQRMAGTLAQLVETLASAEPGAQEVEEALVSAETGTQGARGALKCKQTLSNIWQRNAIDERSMATSDQAQALLKGTRIKQNCKERLTLKLINDVVEYANQMESKERIHSRMTCTPICAHCARTPERYLGRKLGSCDQ